MRLLSLDVFRAISIILMVIANVGFLGEHAEPNIALVDLIFPFFLFCVGFSIPYSKKTTKQKVLRTVILFALGVFLNGFPLFNLGTIRIMSVLQRIALCYFICSIILVRLNHFHKKIFLFSLLIFYSLILIVDSGVISKIDLFILRGHTYNALGDPEGLLSTVGAVCSTMFGQIIGESPKKETKKLLLFSALCLLISLFLSFSIPISKDLWSTSYVFYTSAFAILSFSILYYLIDVKRKFIISSKVLGSLGSNAILVYVVSAFVYHLNVLNQSLVYVILYLSLWVVICNLSKIHIRI
jgi:predicted acyltransferase